MILKSRLTVSEQGKRIITIMNINMIKSRYYNAREEKRHSLLTEKREVLSKAQAESGKKLILLSSDCTGGRLLRDFELPEYTPTVNNWYSGRDFLKICNDPDKYFSCEVVSGGVDSHNEPIGLIDDVVIHFGHSSGYEESVKKWEIGCKSYFRAIRKGNYQICIIMNDRNGFQENMVNEFDALPYDNKVLFVHRKDWESPNIFYMENEDDLEYVDVMTNFESKLTTRRRYDRFDFYNWFLKMYIGNGV